jgi:RNA polymerase sigma-70 factor (ECF subfamily)
VESPVPDRTRPRSRSGTPRGAAGEGASPQDQEGADVRSLIPHSVEVLFTQSYRSIVQTLALAGGDLAAAEDATQEAFAQAWVRWSRISRYDNPGAWVRRVAINKLRNAHRSRLRGEAAIQRMGSEPVADPGADEPGTDLVTALQALPYKQRLCAALFYLDGLSTAEVAQAMGISPGSVSQHLNRARTALRAHVEATA